MQINNEKFTPALFTNKVLARQDKLGKDACEIMAAAINAADPYACVVNYLKNKDDSIVINGEIISKETYDRILVIGMGKASVPMAQAALDIFSQEINTAAVVTKDRVTLGKNRQRDHLKIYIGNHPIPSKLSVDATKSILDNLQDLTSRDLVLVLISGGGSSLFTLPAENIRIEEIRNMTEILLRCGADINEINTLRSLVDEVKGGGLADKLRPAKVYSLILSDVLGDKVETIASGPTASPASEGLNVNEIIEKYELNEKLSPKIISLIKRRSENNDGKFNNSDNKNNNEKRNIIVGSNFQTLAEAKRKATSLGYYSTIITSHLTGETEDVAQFIHGIIKSEIIHQVPNKMPACLIFGGETTVKVIGNGLGGRNQDLSIRMAKLIAGESGTLFIALATDGNDGPTDASGAAVDGFVMDEGKQSEGLNIDSFIKNNDSYHYLDKLGALIKTGLTGTNVNDINIVMINR